MSFKEYLPYTRLTKLNDHQDIKHLDKNTFKFKGLEKKRTQMEKKNIYLELLSHIDIQTSG